MTNNFGITIMVLVGIDLPELIRLKRSKRCIILRSLFLVGIDLPELIRLKPSSDQSSCISTLSTSGLICLN